MAHKWILYGEEMRKTFILHTQACTPTQTCIYSSTHHSEGNTGSCWPDIIAESGISRFMEWSCLKHEMEREIKEDIISFWLHHTHTLMHSYAQCTHAHSHKIELEYYDKNNCLILLWPRWTSPSVNLLPSL